MRYSVVMVVSMSGSCEYLVCCYNGQMGSLYCTSERRGGGVQPVDLTSSLKYLSSA